MQNSPVPDSHSLISITPCKGVSPPGGIGLWFFQTPNRFPFPGWMDRPMFLLLRIFQRSGGIAAAAIVLVGLAFYGVALLSVALVEDPSRALRIVAVFILLSGIFCAFLMWAIRKAIAQARRPLDTAYNATSRLASMGGRGGRSAVRFLGRRSASARRVISSAAAAVLRGVRRVGGLLGRVRFSKGKKPPAEAFPPADVIPLRCPDGSRKTGS